MNKLNSVQTWKGFHWAFFINIQGLIICLQRFEKYVMTEDIPKAKIELETATQLILASGAAMQLAGSFNRQEYENKVRQTMTPPSVQSENFSGLMSWEHASLIQLWKKLRPVFETLPPSLKPHHEKFVAAYFSLINSHKKVCKKFGGGESGSLRFGNTKAVDTLEKFGHGRAKLIK
ncbi:hypothetical protein cce_3049 [Crocosphaera subtropica ATCC 51142]|uniref:Siderophore biosynthesis protein n=1 Tax=Crocosphaera subtropica (strain ATCC 51142 / BH68) TaxID=43989 RepID=B1WWS8_CROS5|nr:hypothetical protein [Crocosphaera subtropica]ACB52397.1 hypothetical protein cce_3049 [Crocosphaera subtropica ATCC 51142]